MDAQQVLEVVAKEQLLNMKKVLFYIFVVLSTSSFSQKTLEDLLDKYNKESIPYISVDDLHKAQLNDSLVILDAREQDEFDVSHIATAKNVGYDYFSSEKISKEITDKNTAIVVYCSIGIRSEDIGEKLEKAGFTNVKNLYGGIFEWKNKGYPVLNTDGKETERVHTYSKQWSKWLHKGVKVYD